MKACTAEQMRAIDRRAVHEFRMPSLLLMENAGRAVAERVLAWLGERHAPCAPGRVVLLCGRGNNGGDGFVAARHLLSRGVSVTTLLAGDPERLTGDARVNYDLLTALGAAPKPFAGELPPAALVVDALLGTGFHGAPREPVAGAIRAVNGAGAPVLAVDVPSGLDSDSGRASDPCVLAAETVTFGLPKVGLLGYPGRELAGAITVAGISLPRAVLADPTLDTEWLTAPAAAPLWPARHRAAHKAGRVFVVAGSAGLTGAAVLTCEAALRAGAGLVTLGIPASLNLAMESRLVEAMTLPLPETEGQAHSAAALTLACERAAASDALALGPGFGRNPSSGELLRGLLAGCPIPVVVDADGLNLLAPAGERTFPSRAVVTPHPGEMARLLGTPVAGVESNRLEAARKAARKWGCVVVLKGAATVVAAPDGRVAVNASGSPALATGGSGDVLTGMVAACLARGLAPWDAARAAVFAHGLAGEVAEERWGAPGALAGDVVTAIPEALRRLRAGEVPLPCRMI